MMSRRQSVFPTAAELTRLVNAGYAASQERRRQRGKATDPKPVRWKLGYGKAHEDR